jgi:hypothetical protein
VRLLALKLLKVRLAGVNVQAEVAERGDKRYLALGEVQLIYMAKPITCKLKKYIILSL